MKKNAETIKMQRRLAPGPSMKTIGLAWLRLAVLTPFLHLFLQSTSATSVTSRTAASERQSYTIDYVHDGNYYHGCHNDILYDFLHIY